MNAKANFTALSFDALRDFIEAALASQGLRRGQDDLKVIMMCELPTNALLAR